MGKLNSRFKKHRVMHIDDSLQPIEVYAVDMIDAAKIAAEIWVEDVPNQVVSSEVICYAVQVEELFNPGGFHYPGYCQGVVSSVWSESLFVLRWEFTEVSDYRGYKEEISRIIREKKYGIK